jgi:endonuclease/exonuclease/phosphatase (EEP) superfamily protein YafD
MERLRLPSFTALLAAAAWAYLLGVFAVTCILVLLADRWWPATMILFGPRWVWAVPLGVLVPAAARHHRLLLVPLGVAGMLVLFTITGFEVPSPRVLLADKSHRDLRVMTYNVGGAEIDPRTLPPLLDFLAPDVALFQECNTLLEGAKRPLERRGWHVGIQYGSCIASRFPIVAVDQRDLHDVWQMNGSGVIVRYEIGVPGIALNVVNMHLETVRDGLQAVVRRAPWRGAAQLEANIRQRDFESMIGHAWTARATGPLLVTCDCNMPVESAIYDRHWSSFTNAFSAAGFGFGHTKETNWHGIRIDHVLLGPGWRPLRAFVGPHLGGDHRPMVTDLVLRREETEGGR